ncbi:MAG: VOC family protein [Myxococcota bacterium]
MPKQGEFVWHDLATHDMDAASAFYADLIGWTAAPMEGSPMPYSAFMVGEVGVGGVMTLTEEMRAMGAPPSWTPCMAVEDIEAFAGQVGELGGRILTPPQEAPGGRFAVAQDPQGAVFEVYEAQDKNGEVEQLADPPTGHFCWYDLNTNDWEGARAFYGALFQWSESGSMDSPGGTYWMFKSQSGSRTVGGMSNMAAKMEIPPHWLCYVTVADLEAAVEKLKARGGQVMNGPMEVPGGDRIVHCIDPQGAPIALHVPAS